MPNYQEKPRRAEIVSTRPRMGKTNPATGHRPIVGTEIIDKDAKVTILLTPAGKTAKAAEELRRGVKMTNAGEVKTNRNGNPMTLTKEERAYRAGRLDQAKDSAKCYNATQAKAAKQGKKGK